MSVEVEPGSRNAEDMPAEKVVGQTANIAASPPGHSRPAGLTFNHCNGADHRKRPLPTWKRAEGHQDAGLGRGLARAGAGCCREHSAWLTSNRVRWFASPGDDRLKSTQQSFQLLGVHWFGEVKVDAGLCRMPAVGFLPKPCNGDEQRL